MSWVSGWARCGGGARRSELAALALLSALLVVPTFIQEPPSRHGITLRLPFVHIGDEPHYLVMLNSVIQDGDLDLRNDYLSVALGSSEAGRLNRGNPSLDPHISLYVEGQVEHFGDLYDLWPRQRPDGRIFYLPKPTAPPVAIQHPFSPMHPPGIALLLAPFVFPFRGTAWVEPIAIVLATLSTLWAMLLFYGVCRRLSDSFAALAVTTAAFLGTPVWFYAKTFFNEPFILLGLVGAVAFTLAKKPVRAGAFLAAAILMKPYFALVGPLLAAWSLGESSWRTRVRWTLRLALFPLLAVLALGWLNWHLYGSPLRSSIPWTWGDFRTGAAGLLLSKDHGILPWSPALALGLVGWGLLIRRKPLEAILVLLAFAVLFAVAASWSSWEGGWCIGPRLIIASVPLWALGLLPLLEASSRTQRVFRPVVAGGVLVGVFLNACLVINPMKVPTAKRVLEVWQAGVPPWDPRL